MSLSLLAVSCGEGGGSGDDSVIGGGADSDGYGLSDLSETTGWDILVDPQGFVLADRVLGIEGLYVVAGFSGYGFKLAPIIGQGVPLSARNFSIDGIRVRV